MLSQSSLSFFLELLDVVDKTGIAVYLKLLLFLIFQKLLLSLILLFIDNLVNLSDIRRRLISFINA